MKKIIPAIPIILLLLLSACSSAAESSDPVASSTLVADLVNQNLTASAPVAAQPSPEAATIQLATDYTNAVSIEMQLLLGSINLEGTEQAITAEQASLLIPLWTNFKTLSQSMMPAQGGGQPNSTPQPQIDELTKEIQASMTSEQIKAIVAMQITQENAQTIMQAQGLTMGNPLQGNGGQPSQGNMSQGTPPAGGPGGMRQGMGFIPKELLDALIQLLKQKAGL